MCGIAGYIGEEQAREIIIDGLKRLEYRGYDSAGVAIAGDKGLQIRKAVGRIENLEKLMAEEPVSGNLGIGHTRWATHGEPTKVNAHPHTNEDGTIAVVHNGIIENYAELRTWLKDEHGVTFKSETDTEVIAHLIGLMYKGDLLEAVFEAVSKLSGAYAIGVVCADEPDRIVAVRNDAPLIVGLGENCNFLASDIPAMLKYCRSIYFIENCETVLITKDEVTIFNAKREKVKRDIYHVTMDADAAEKGGHDHFMIKEIYEQPQGILKTIERRLDENGRVKLDGIKLTRKELSDIERVYIVACGTAYHAGLIGKYAIERFAGIPVEVDIASEFRYRNPFVNAKTLFICISQSGETLDTLMALREAKKKGARVLSIVNVVGSSVARESDDVFYTWAGPEIAVASTKAFTTQMVCLYLLALYMAAENGTLEEGQFTRVMDELKRTPELIREVLSRENAIKKIAKRIYKNENVFFIGRGLDASIAFEGALKLKEISYIHAFAIAAGELKHGTIALLDMDTLVITLASQTALNDKIVSNIKEVKARGAEVISLAKDGAVKIADESDDVIYIPECIDEVAPILAIVPLQLLAYHIAKLRGCDIDKPKNLAKSVTVE
ncbi:MAG: glutamine--fructose-6-phosphate transaminase (isomerizing) [Clostridiales Family XIII bacterium]|jgi:glucosamine--fructose-6-phosphate aminotransferase (isomerizing)|nr:glutamine--fructose-6-phosphate transaminase (isomerizing) [Clostridiales Family XIII bacterium]